MLILAIGCLSLKQVVLAGMLIAYAIYFAAIRTVPSVLNKICVFSISRSKYKQAEKLARFGLVWCDVLKIGSIGSLPRSLSWDTLLKQHLAQALIQQGRFEQAVEVHQQILTLLESERDFIGAANISGKLAYCYTQQGKISKAADLLERVVPVLEAAANNADSTNDRLARAYRGRLCTALFEQATLLETKRDFDGAEVIRRKAANMSMQMYDEPDRNKSMPYLAMLGKLLIRLGKYDEAESLLKDVHEVRLKRLAPDSILIASAKQGLGRLYCATDRLPTAEPFLLDALRCVEKVADGKHPDLPEYRCDLAKLRIKQAKYSEAESLINSAIEQKEQQSGKNHPGLIDFLLVLADLKRKSGHLAEAESAQEQADKILATI